MNDLMIKEQIQVPVIAINFDELESQAKQIAQTYTSVAITDDTYLSAKADAKKLAGYVSDIEKRRKALKSQVEAPIKEFDKKCKDIEKILTDAKSEIESVTVKYDNERIKEQQDKCKKYADSAIAKAGLRPEYASRIVEPAIAKNLSATLKSIKAAYDEQIDTLKNYQDRYDSLVSAANAAIDAVNNDITQKLEFSEFANNIAAYSENLDCMDIPGIITSEIMKRASDIKEAEERIRQKAIEEERLRQKQEEERRAAEEASKISEEMAAADTAAISETPDAPVVNSVTPAETHTASPFQSNPFGQTEPKWQGTITLTGTVSSLQNVLTILRNAVATNNVELVVGETRQI